ncbi:MAG: metallophosphoesterase [Lachnospiraceae bacterium]|nr:metallophosphoesterase [Lachnospiraceae bacterium]
MPCKTVLYRLSVPGWEEGRTVRIGLLADLHNNFSPGLIQTIRAGSPDLLVSAGDMTTSRHAGGPQLFARAYGLLSALAAEFPLYLANGNHEARWKADPGRAALFEAFRRGLLRKGALFLENASVTLSLHGVSLRLSGLDLPIEYSVRVFDPAARKKRRLPEGLLAQLLGPPSAVPSVPQILLSHDPKDFEACRAWGADLVLSGHIHGGLIRLPFAGGLIGPGPELFPPYDRGLFAEDGSLMIVSAGLGMHSIPLRLFDPPEYVLIDLIGTRLPVLAPKELSVWTLP